MKVTKYYCDCCGREVGEEGDLTGWDVYSSFKDMQDNSHPYDYYEICPSCCDKIEKVIVDKFNEIRKENNNGI